MRVRTRVCPQCLLAAPRARAPHGVCLQTASARHASSAIATTPAPPPEQVSYAIHPISTTPPSQPASHRQPDIRRTQLHRQYTSLLRSSPLLLLFQHNNLRAVEWMALRRELASALAAVDAQDGSSAGEGIGAGARLQIVRGGVFGAALRVVENWDASSAAASPPSAADATASAPTIHPTDPRTHTSFAVPTHTPPHALSREAREAARRGPQPALQPLLLGPLAVLSFPALSPAHLKAALRLLAPRAPQFAAPSRRERPGYWEPATQAAVRKVMLLAARVEAGRVLDPDGARWVGGIDGGIDGLRAQLVAVLQSAGAGLAGALEGVGGGLYLTMEGRRMEMEKEQGGHAGESAGGEA